MAMRQIVLVVHNVRSCHNVGSLLRTAEGLGVATVYLTGYTPFPLAVHEHRLPHIAQAMQKQIHKTSLGAELYINWQYSESVYDIFTRLRKDGYKIVGLEQTAKACLLHEFTPPERLVVVVGREVEGIEPEVLAQVNETIMIPMLGQKESFNVVQAAAMALYHCRFTKV